jgi:hypothetical protein
MNRIESQLLPGGGTPTDGYLRRATLGTICGYLLAGSLANPADGYLRRWSHAEVGSTVVVTPPSFPTQYLGLRTYYHAAVQDLCLVAAADAATGMGGAPMVNKNGTTYAVYLVETTDPNASPVRIQTSAGTKAIRVKT